jgi:hypothetical protein
MSAPGRGLREKGRPLSGGTQRVVPVSRWRAGGSRGTALFGLVGLSLVLFAVSRLDGIGQVTTAGLPVQGVADVLHDLEAGKIKSESVAVSGFWSDNSYLHSCAPPHGSPGELELYCRDGEFGITDEPEYILTVAADGTGVPAKSPHLSPFVDPGVQGFDRLFASMDQKARAWPVPVVFIGHFADPRAAECRAIAQSLCASRLVVEVIDKYDTDAAQSPRVDTPVDAPRTDLFDPASCAGPVKYSFVGWSTTSALGLPFDRQGDVFAMVTLEPVLLGGSAWNTSPSDAERQYRPWGRRICVAQTGLAGVVEFGSVAGTEFLEWDDGVETLGLEPVR